MSAPRAAPPDVSTLAPPLPSAITADVVEDMSFDDDVVLVRRVTADGPLDRFGADAFFVPGWASMSGDEKSACALSLVLSLGDEMCERQLSTDSTELTMTLDDVADDGPAAMRRFAVSAVLPSAVGALLDQPAEISDATGDGDDDAVDPTSDDGDARIVTLFGEIEVRDGIALMLYARVPAEEEAHERAIGYLASRQ